MSTLTIMRGLPGSGKSSWVRKYRPVEKVLSADDFFMTSKGYAFYPGGLIEAHARVLCGLLDALDAGEDVVVDNTHSRLCEFMVPLHIARKFDADVTVVSLYDGGMSNEELAARNIHHVPLMVIERMRDQWETCDSEMRLFWRHT